MQNRLELIYQRGAAIGTEPLISSISFAATWTIGGGYLSLHRDSGQLGAAVGAESGADRYTPITVRANDLFRPGFHQGALPGNHQADVSTDT